MKKYFFIFLTLLIVLTVKRGISQTCGVERWNIKTLSDADTVKIDFNNIVPSTVKEQASLPKPTKKKRERLASETTVYSIDCFIVGYKLEDDKDIHIIVNDIETDTTMVIEVISSECPEVQQTSRYILFKEMEEWFTKNIGQPKSKFVFLEKHIPVSITGVGFWDFPHGQKVGALNNREIHPVLSIKLRH